MSFPSPLHLSPLWGLAVSDKVHWVLLLSISGSQSPLKPCLRTQPCTALKLEAGLGWGRDSDCKGEGGCISRELGPAAPSKQCSCSLCNLSGRGGQWGAALTCDLLAIRTTGDVYCFHHTCLEPGFTHVCGRVAGGDAACVGKLGLCSARGAVWGSQERKRQTEEGQAALRGSGGQPRGSRLFDTRLLGGGGAACSGCLPSGN